MIRIFDEKETDFSHDGIEILDDITISCICERELNGTWFLNAEFLRDDDRSNSIENRKILKVPTSMSEQLFRIVNIKSTKSKITVYAEHIFFDNRHNFIEDTNVVKKDGNNALQQILAGCQYKSNFKGVSTVPTIASARLVRKSLLEALMGDQDNSFLNRWGGEIDFNNFDFIIKSQIGENRGVEVTYGHNMQGFEGEVDESGVVTRIMPMGYNGLLLPEKYIDSPLIDNYAFPKIQVVEISSIKVKENEEDEEGYDTEEEAFEAMRNYVSDLYSIQNIDKPSVNIRVNIISLERTDQFKNEIFERIYIGDTLKVNLEKYGFDVSCRIIGERYDSLNSRYVEVELGDVKSNILKDVTSMKETIDDILTQLGDNNWENFLEQARDEAAQLIQEGIKNSYVVAKKNEILIMDSENVETARNVIRMNKNGIAFSQTGYSGPYVIGITIDGKINADCITSGTINAALIRAGRLQSLNNKTWISMEDGSFSLADGKITFDDVNGFKIWLSNNEESDLETSLNNYKEQVSNDIKQLTDKVNNIDSNIGGAIADGIIDTVEKSIIEDSLLKLDKEKKDVDSRYQNVYNNVNLLDPFKTNLYTKYNNFVSKYNTLVSTINTIIEDNVATAEEKVEYKTAMNNYNTVIPQLTVAFDEAISSIGEKITTEQINDLNDLLKEDIKNVSDSLGSLENTMNNSFRDGIINEAEYTAILESLKRLDTEKLDIDKNYKNLYSDINLSSTVKTNLKNKYDSYVSSHNNLTNYINNTIGDRVATEEEKAQIKILLNAYNVALSDYGVAQTQAINDIANNSANGMLESYKQLVNKDISDINQKINDIKDNVGGAIADGIIEEAETLIIQNSIDQLNREKEDLDQRYQEIYNNNHLSSTTKELLSTRYLDYNTAHTNLINQINTMIQDKVATETEKADYKTKLQTYNSSLSLVSRCFDTAINEIAQNNLNSVTEKLKKELQGNIDDVSNVANELNKNFGNYTADGILTESEKASIRTYLNTLSAEKSDIDNQYKSTYKNTDLTGVAKSNLLGAYNNYVTAYDNLVSYINTLLLKTTIVENDRTTLNTRFSEHDSYLSKYSTAINNAIDAISQKKKQDAIDSSKDYYDTQITIDKNGILSTVSNTYSTKQELGNLNTQLSNKIQESINNVSIGGRNYIKDYKFQRQDIWQKQNGSTIDNENNCGILNASTDPVVLYQNFDKGVFNPGDVLTLQFEIKCEDVSANTGSLSFILRPSLTAYNDNGGSGAYVADVAIFKNLETEVGNYSDWTKIVATKTISNNTFDFTKFRLYCRNFTGKVYWRNIKLEKGNRATDLSPAPEDTEIYTDNLVADLQEQVDGKIQTWSQKNDPSTQWTTTEEKKKHEGDIWYNTSTKLTYRWSGSEWVKLSSQEAIEASNLAKSKAQVFTKKPTIPYYVGDLWVTALDGTGVVKTCKTERTSGNFTDTDWVESLKYTDNTLANQLQNELNNLSIGGRNYIQFSDFKTNTNQWVQSKNPENTGTTTVGDGIMTIISSGTGYIQRQIYSNRTATALNELEKNETYTLSVEIMMETVGTGTNAGIDLRFNKLDNSTSTQIRATQDLSKLTPNVWTKIQKTATINWNDTEFDYWRVVIQGAEGQTIHFRKPKLEKGNKATDWTSAVEDTETYIDNLVTDLQDQIDGKIETWSQDTDPSKSWTTDELKTSHKGDLWYNTSTSKTYRWSGKEWVLQPEAEEVAKTKKRIFTTTPKVPYDIGDLWILQSDTAHSAGKKGQILTCSTARSSGSYTTSDWKKTITYTDDTAITNFINNTYSNDLINIKNQIDGKANTYYQTSEPHPNYTNVADNETYNAWVGDLWYNSSSTVKKTYIYTKTANGPNYNYQWKQQEIPADMFDMIDGKKSIYSSKPSKYYKNDLWILESDTVHTAGKKGEILTCTTTATSYNASHWSKKISYTDDSYAKSVQTQFVQRADSIEASVTSLQETTEGFITKTNSSISLLQGQIESKVDVNGVNSVIKQNPESIKIGFNGISDNASISADGLTLKNGYFKVLDGNGTQIAYIGQDNWMRLQGLKVYGAGQCFQNVGTGVRSLLITSTDNKSTHIDFNSGTPTASNPYSVRIMREGNSSQLSILASSLILQSTKANSTQNLEIRSQNGATFIDFTSNATDDYHTRLITYGNEGNLHFVSRDSAGSFIVNGALRVTGNKNCIQETKNYGRVAFYAVEDCESYFTDTCTETLTVDNSNQRVVLIDTAFKECVNTELPYIVDIHKVGWGDYRILEQTKDYFIVESDRSDFTFKYTIKGKRRGYENERLEQIYENERDEIVKTK